MGNELWLRRANWLQHGRLEWPVAAVNATLLDFTVCALLRHVWVTAHISRDMRFGMDWLQHTRWLQYSH